MVDANERMRIADLFQKRIKKDRFFKGLGQMLGINQRIKSDAF